MIFIFFMSAFGWLAILLLGAGILLPYLLRCNRLSETLGIAPGPGTRYLQRMWGHYWSGYLLVILSMGHAWISMAGSRLGRMNMTGVWLATIALGLLLLQTASGLVLKKTNVQLRKSIRRQHYWCMIALVVLVAAHVWLNG